VASLLLGQLAGGCGANEKSSGGSGSVTQPGPPLVVGLTRSSRPLARDALASDALEPARLLEVLDEAGFRGGSEDEYSGRTDLYNHVVSRRLAFEGPGGAARYVDWLRTNAADLLGTAKPADPFDVGADGFLTRDAGCGCHSDLPTFLAAWRDGASVQTLLADGPGVDRARFVALARQLG
jgi:hypothetical protein